MYKFRVNTTKRVHIVNPETEKTFCKIENSDAGKKLNGVAAVAPIGRKICSVCEGMRDYVQKGGTLRDRAAKQAKKPPSSKAFYQSWEWAQLRFDVLRKYGPKCMLCGVTSATSKIVVDHIKPRSFYPELELEFSNMQVLCDLCNRGKSRREVDFRDLHFEEQVNSHMKSILNG